MFLATATTYKTSEQNDLYFVTLTVEEWIDIFTVNEYWQVVADSLSHCDTDKGAEVYAFVVTANHLHLIISSPKHEL